MAKHSKSIFKQLGPGIITGAADDDPSGIATYSQTGAKYGTGMLWTAVYMLPMMYAVQEMAARIGLVTGKGVAQNMKENYPKLMLYIIVLLLVIANTINLGADLGAIAAAVQLLVPIPFTVILIATTLGIIYLEVFTSYKQYAKILKWLTLSLFAYILTGLFIKVDWLSIARASLIPSFSFNFDYVFILVGVLGTSISPYMMFWQANEEVEEEMEQGKLSRKGGVPIITWKIIKRMRLDTFFGMLFSEIATWFIIMTTATTLHKHGITNIETAAQAAAALEPLVQSFPYAGTIAKILFALGVVGTGLLAIPIFAGGSSYAISEMFNWKEGLNKKFNRAKAFYIVIVLSTLIGLSINFIGINPIQALVYTAVLNGIISVPLIGVLLLISNNKKIMGEYKTPLYITILGWITFIVMGLGAGSILFTTLVK